MKKILALILVSALLVAAFAVTSSADKVNENITVQYLRTAPNIDGTVSAGEYGKAIVEYRHEYKDELDGVIHEHDKYDDWDFDFYAGWDEEYLYLAWIAYTDVHAGLPVTVKETNGSGYMWEFSCVQFILTPGAPKKGETHYQGGAYDGDYMEVGLTLMDDGNTEKVVWAKFNGGESLTANDWDGLVTRDDAKNETHYEVRLPWQKSGVPVVGNDHQFGITFAVAAQEFYGDAIQNYNPGDAIAKPGMLEWQDGILGVKNADAAGVITLAGAPEEIGDISVEPMLPEGTVPGNVTADSVKLGIDSVNTGITEDKSTVIMDPTKHTDYNTTYTGLLLLAPVEGEENTYYIVESLSGTTGDPLSFETEITEGMIAAAFHGDGSESEAAQRKAAALGLELGTKLHLFGVADGKLQYSNAMLYTVAGEEKVDLGGEESSEETVESSEETVESSEETVESSEEPAESSEEAVESKPAEEESKAAEESKTEEKGGLGTGAIIGIIVAAVAVIGAAAGIIIAKKKKAA